MASSYLMRLGKIKGKNGVLFALKHNKRTLQSERGVSANINFARTPLNYSLTESNSPENIAQHAKVQMLKSGIDNPRSNLVCAVEVIFSLPINYHDKDTRQFFIDCLDWVKNTFSGEILSFDVHLDESAPHAHAVILPLIDGKMNGSDMVGGTGNLMRLINKFHHDIARHYGLSRSEKKRQSPAAKAETEKLVLTHLCDDPIMNSSIWACVRDSIHHDPYPYAQMLNVKLTDKTINHKSFLDIRRSKGKGTFIH